MNQTTPVHKLCSTCKQNKAETEFHKYKKGTLGLQGNCIPCQKKISRVQAWKRQGIDIDYDKYEGMLKDQDKCCAICDFEPNGADLAVDHDHDTKKIRGLLCQNCNTALGKFRDSPARLKRALEYLALHGKTPESETEADSNEVSSVD